jgi:hypothetical protein
VVVIYSFVDSIVNLCNCCYLDSTRLMCMLRCAYFAWWAFPKRHRANCGMMAIIRKMPILGASQVVSEPRFCRYPRVRSACRITLPTVVVVSSVKTILLKMSWIGLSSSAFYSLPLCFSPLTFLSFESSLLPSSSSFRILRGWTISSLYPNRFVLQKFIIVNVSKNPLLLVSRKNLLLVVSTSSIWCMKIR